MSSRRVYPPSRAGIVAVGALAVAALLVALAVTVASLRQTPTYEASAHMLVAQQQGDRQIQPIPNAPTPERLKEISQAVAGAIDTRTVAEEAIQRLELQEAPEELLENLSVEQVEASQIIRLAYTDTDPQRAKEVVNTIGEVSSERISKTRAAGLNITATLYESAAVPDTPVSPNPLRNGILASGLGMMLCVSLALALPRIAAASGIGRGALRAATGARRAAVGGARRVSATEPAKEPAKEKELLEALGRRGALTVVGAALETSLTVEEAERMLSALAARGHLEVSVEHGRLLYSLWERDSPL